MPQVRNKTKQGFELKIGRFLEPEETIEVSDEEAAQLAGHPLLDFPESVSAHNEGEGESE